MSSDELNIMAEVIALLQLELQKVRSGFEPRGAMMDQDLDSAARIVAVWELLVHFECG